MKRDFQLDLFELPKRGARGRRFESFYTDQFFCFPKACDHCRRLFALGPATPHCQLSWFEPARFTVAPGANKRQMHVQYQAVRTSTHRPSYFICPKIKIAVLTSFTSGWTGATWRGGANGNRRWQVLARSSAKKWRCMAMWKADFAITTSYASTCVRWKNSFRIMVTFFWSRTVRHPPGLKALQASRSLTIATLSRLPHCPPLTLAISSPISTVFQTCRNVFSI